MPKFATLLLVLILTHYIGLAQKDVSIQLRPFIKKDEVRKYHITSESFVEKGIFEEFTATEKDVSIKIIDILNDKIAIEWTFDKITFTTSASQYNPLLDLVNTLNKNMIVEYVTDPTGTIQSIGNYDEIKSRVKQRVDSILQTMVQSSNTGDTKVEAAKFQLDLILSSQEFFDVLVLEDVYKFHELYGLSFRENTKTIIQEKDVPTDSYAVELISTNNNRYRLIGDLVSSFSDKKGERVYEFGLPTCWLEYYSSKWSATVPMAVSNSYTIVLTNH